MLKNSFKKTISKLPDTPGVYLFKHIKPFRQSGDILYIGKATSLRNRIRSYFSKDIINTRGPLIVKMLRETNKIDYTETDSVLEALILEANLIKKHQPYYNTKEKDDKSFNFICITREKLPRVMVVREKNLGRKQKNFTHSYGPYTSGPQLFTALKLVRRIFPFLDDKSKNYLEFYKQINLVPDLNDRRMYMQNIRNIKLFFSGRKKQIVKNLKKEMNTYAKAREFEKAGEVKRQLFALKHINDIALLKNTSFANNFPRVPLGDTRRGYREQKIRSSFTRIEAYDIAHMAGRSMVGVMTVVEGGEIEKKEYKKFKIRTLSGANDTGALREILERRLAHREWVYPSLIVVDGGKAQLNVYTKIMARFDLDIQVVAVVKDERHKPKGILGDKKIVKKYEKEILLANSEAHRFAIAYHKKLRGKNFLK